MNQECIFLQGKDSMLQLIGGSKEDLLKSVGNELQCVEATMTEGAGEKHLPAVTVSGNEICVQIGSVIHPMTEEHSIQWIYLQTKKGGQIVHLNPSEEPKACFLVAQGEEALCVYAYCNLHGLWKQSL